MAQSSGGSIANEGSVYSKFGVGMPVTFGSSSAAGMGLWGVSYIEKFVPGLANPAHWGSVVYGMGTGGLSVKNFSATDGSGDARHTLVGVDHFQLILPLYKNKLGLSFSFAPYSQVAFQNSKLGTKIIGSGSTADTLRFQTQTIGDGGINRIEVGLGWKITNNFSVGYAASLMFASIDDQYTTFFDDGDYSPVDVTYQTSGLGFGNRVGVYWTLPSLLRENDQLNLGVAVTMPVTIHAERIEETRYVTVNSTEEDKRKVDEGDIKLPLGVMAGITYQLNPQFSMTAEGLYQQWSSYENEIKEDDVQMLTDRLKIGAGIRYNPVLTGSDKFLSNFKYRLGIAYDKGHLKLSGQDIETILFSAGLGFFTPTRRSGSSVDISVHYGIRGATGQGLVRENIWGVKLSLNLAELFFYRPKLQ